MTHEAALNLLLALACPCEEPDADGFSKYYVELHCAAFIIQAKCVGKPEMWEDEGKPSQEWFESFIFEIKSLEKV